jgi:cell division septation protein DedD
MEEQVSWKGHSFTLLVFTGIVFLCSIFFVLGMLVGRGQGQRSAKAAAQGDEAKIEAAAARNPPEDPKSRIASYEGVETGKARTAPADLDPAPAPAPALTPASAEPVIEVAQEKHAPKPPVSEKMIFIQVAALEKEAAARAEQDKLLKKGFAALISSGEGPNKLFHVQVGPFSSSSDAEAAKKKLEALGYKTLTKQ